MKTLVIHRRIQLPSLLVPFWAVTGISKAEFMARHQLPDELSCSLDTWGHPIARTQFCPGEYGVPIYCGKTVQLAAGEGACTLFAPDGRGAAFQRACFARQAAGVYSILLEAKGGWRAPSYPAPAPCRAGAGPVAAVPAPFPHTRPEGSRLPGRRFCTAARRAAKKRRRALPGRAAHFCALCKSQKACGLFFLFRLGRLFPFGLILREIHLKFCAAVGAGEVV